MAGEKVSINLPAELSGKGCFIRIGCHTDKNWHLPELTRHPEISRSFVAHAGVNNVYNEHGGLIYIEVPRQTLSDTAGIVEIMVSGGIVEAPYFILGKTDVKEWERLRHAPAPWAELQCERIVLTVPSELIRSLEDPRPLMEFWNKVLAYYSDLGSRPLDSRPQRIVADRQLSGGWMHAGYPIMANIDTAPMMVSLQRLSSPKNESEGAWGFWHELGHNHQRPEWTFSGSVEVSCNLFTLYVEENIRGIVPRDHPWLRGQIERKNKYLESPDFEVWKKDPGLALWFFVEIQSSFGWKVFRDFFASFVNVPENELPKTDLEKHDQWLIRLSRACGRNLAPYFKRWAVPVSEKACRTVTGYPAWQP